MSEGREFEVWRERRDRLTEVVEISGVLGIGAKILGEAGLGDLRNGERRKEERRMRGRKRTERKAENEERELSEAERQEEGCRHKGMQTGRDRLPDSSARHLFPRELTQKVHSST